MAGEPGFEFWGPYEHADAVRDAVRTAGEDYDLRRLGSKSYQSANVVLGWVPLPLPAIYSGATMRPFREWLDARRGVLSIGGSYDSPDIEDYYVTPVELGYGRLIDFDHEFVGRDALEAEVEQPRRTKVTLVWDDGGVVDAFGSLFGDGETARYMDLPVPRSSACHYDAVLAEGDHVGVSKWMSYHYNERAMLSLAIVDVEYSEPGTELTLVWGEAGGAANPVVERHAVTEIGVTVAPVPYAEDQR
jgi:glycine cleavage system aminomethyltransferase T